MSSSSSELHKIWIEQCAATEDIRGRFGLENALDYLIGEKLFSFVMASERDPDFAAELPAFIAEIRRIFTAEEIRAYLDHLARTKILAPPTRIWKSMIPPTRRREKPGRRIPSWGRKNSSVSRASASSFNNSNAYPTDRRQAGVIPTLGLPGGKSQPCAAYTCLPKGHPIAP